MLLKEAMAIARKEIISLTNNQIDEVYIAMQRNVNRRLKKLDKLSEEGFTSFSMFPKKYNYFVKYNKKLSRYEKISTIADMRRFLNSETSTVRGVKNQQEKALERFGVKKGPKRNKKQGIIGDNKQANKQLRYFWESWNKYKEQHPEITQASFYKNIIDNLKEVIWDKTKKQMLADMTRIIDDMYEWEARDNYEKNIVFGNQESWDMQVDSNGGLGV